MGPDDLDRTINILLGWGGLFAIADLGLLGVWLLLRILKDYADLREKE